MGSSRSPVESSRRILPFSREILPSLQTLTQTINQMPKIKPLQGEQLPLDELLPEAETIAHKPVKKPFKVEPLYRVENLRY